MPEVYVVDDHALLRQGIISIVQKGGVQVAGEAASVPELKRLLNSKVPDAVVLDISMPEGTGLEALASLKLSYPKLPILMLSMYPEEQYAIRSIRLGASGYLSKQCAPEMLVQAIKTVLRGERFLTNKVAELIADQLQSRDPNRPPHETLSERELEVLLAIAAGTPLSVIAKAAHISVKTIGTYRTRVLKKLNLSNNAEIVRYVIDHNLLPR